MSRSASSTTRTCQRRPTGASAARRTSSRDLVDADRELLGADHRDVGVRAGEHRRGRRGTSPQPAVACALQGGGEGDRGVRASGARRPGEQPGVASCPRPPATRAQGARPPARWPTRSSQTGHADPAQARPAAGRPARGRRRRSPRRSARASSDEVVVGVGGGQREERRRGPAGGTPATRPRSGRGPRTGPARRSGSRSSTHGQVRAQVAGRPARHVLDLGGVERAAGALVGQRGVDVAVGDRPPRRGRAPGRTTVSTCSALSAA